MDIVGYRINFDALLARLVYRWRLQALAAAALLLALGGLASDLIPPFWRGRAELTIVAAHGATVLVDGRAWPWPIYAGAHRLQASMPDGRAAWTDITLAASTALTVTLPAGLPLPTERSVPSAAPGTHIGQVWWADGAWRVLSLPDSPARVSETGRETAGPTPSPQPGQTVAVGTQSVERLSTLDAYAGLADQVHIHGQLREAVYRPAVRAGYGDQPLGAIEVRGWGGAMQTLPISAPLTLLRFAPDGNALLWAEQVANNGQQVYLVRRDGVRTPIVALPGQIARVSWRPDSSAVVLHSIEGDRLTLTLVRLAPSIVAAAIADLPAANYAGALVPLTWDDNGLVWVAPDGGRSALWRAPLSTLIAERASALDARAIDCLPNGVLRVVVIQDGHVVIGRYQDGLIISETTAPQVQPAADLSGIWQGSELLLQGGGQTWLLHVNESEHK
jgi:hypothetical protein